VFLYTEESRPVGFAQCQLRSDYVEGTKLSPVGYLEGIYVEPEYRRRGIARALLRRCEQWAQEKGCAEFASDCELDNRESITFHMHAGFSEANRIVCFAKWL
jgi:aminoglycoside 6'-N-acetyltransferase I